MDYKELIKERQSYRNYKDKKINRNSIEEIKAFFEKTLDVGKNGISLRVYTNEEDASKRLEGVVGYKGYALDAPMYIILMGKKSDDAYIEAGFKGMDIILKLQDMGIQTCFLTVDNSEFVKKVLLMETEMDVLSVIACGFARKESIKLNRRLDIINPTNIKIIERKGYEAPKISLSEMVYDGEWGKPFEFVEGLTDDVLYEALYAASLAPYYFNKQDYHYIIKDSLIILCNKKDPKVLREDALIGMGCTMFNFSAVYRGNAGNWNIGAYDIDIPKDYEVIAYRNR